MTATIEETAAGTGAEPEDGIPGPDELEKITELASFDPERVDGVDVPATGRPFLMLKSLGTPDQRAADARADTEQERHIADVKTPDETKAPQAPPAPAPEPEQAAKSASGGNGLGVITLPPSPADMARLRTYRQQLVMATAAVKAAAKAGDSTVAKDKKKTGPPVGLTDAIKREFVKGMSDPKVTPTEHVSQWLHRCNEWASTGSYPTGLDYGDVRWMAEQCVKILKDRNPDSAASMDGFPAAKASKRAAKPGSAAKCAAGSKALTAAASDAEGNDTRKSAEKASKPKKAKPWKGNKPFPGAAPPYKAGNDGESAPKPGPAKKADKGYVPQPYHADPDEKVICPQCGKHNDTDASYCDQCGFELKGASGVKVEKARKTCKCGALMAKGDKFCASCGTPAGGKAKKAKNAKPEPADAKVDAAISRLESDADAALAAQHADPDDKTHPADRRVDEELERVKDDVEAAAAAQAKDEETDDPAQHAAKSAAGGAPYHLGRLHDATCMALRADDVIAAHPLLAKGIAAVADPSGLAAMMSAAYAEDGGTGTRAAELPALSAAYHTAISLKALSAQDGLLDAAMADMRKAFTDAYPTAHPKPGVITPGEFRRPYITRGRANESAAPGQHPRVPLASHVPDPADFRRPLITEGREAASPGSKPSGVGKAARTYYTTEARDEARGVLAAMHDYIAGQHPEVCPMTTVTYDGEDAVPGTMGTSLTTAAPLPQRMGANRDRAVPVPVPPGRAASVVTPGPARKGSKTKEARKMAKAAKRDKALAKAAPAVPQTPAFDPELIKSALRDAVAEQFGDVTKTIGSLEERLTAMESAPDPAQMAPRSGAAALAKARASGPEVPAGGDGARDTERLMRLMKKAVQDPDSGVRTAAIGELMETVGREKAVELLAAAT